MDRNQAALHRFDGRPKPLIPNGVLGMLIFIFTEVMFFTALICAFLIIKSSFEQWPPLDQPRLPIAATAFNSLVLILSGVTLFFASRAFGKDNKAKAKKFTLFALLLGSFFVALQGYEWVSLLNHGLTISSSTYGSFFYMIIGTHGLHALAAILMLGYVYLKQKSDQCHKSQLWTAEAFWYFVVGVWPILYVSVYLA